MSINLDAVGVRREPQIVSWSGAQSLLYALGVGAGSSESYDELAFTTENSNGRQHQMLPTFAVLLGSLTIEGPELNTRNPMQDAGDFSLSQVLHGEQSLRLRETLSPAGSATATSYISAIHDAGRHAVIENVSELRDVHDGHLLAETVSSIVVRDEGGFGGAPASTPSWVLPAGPADHTVVLATRLEQALIYRLSGDRNPLHSDPWFARSAGMAQPILHGLCSFGFTGRALLHELCGGDPDRFGSISARFASTVLPGDELTISIWRTGDGDAVFRAAVGDRVVLDKGQFGVRH